VRNVRRTGISPVIATVILVAVAIAVAVAVAFWMTGIVGIFTGRVEQVEVVAAVAYGTAPDHVVKITLKNSGTSPVTIDGVFITPTEYAGSILNATIGDITYKAPENATDLPGVNDINTNSKVQIPAGESATLYIQLTNTKSGGSVEIKVHSAGGKEYPKLVVLP